ncbi:MAG: hypothetical protein ACR2FN_01040 [Chitinophagaceae bacterium]
MILELIERYYYFYWLIFWLIALLKITLSIPIVGSIQGTVGFFIVLFKWYNQIEISTAETHHRKMQMRVQNVLTCAMYFWLIVIAGVSTLKILL